MKKLVLIGLSCLPLTLCAQSLHLNLFGGFTNYQGDMQEKVFTLDQSNGGFGAGLTYDITGHFSLRGGLMYGKATADDKRNKPSLQERNLNFGSKIYEANVLGEYNLFDLSENRLTPYVFGGIALYHFSPYTYDTLGNKAFLQPLSTEGQGFYDGRKPYKLTQLAIPFGGGVKFRVTENLTIAYEVGLRKLFTDYFDDVSKTYTDQNLLLAAKGPTAAELSYRGDELKNGNPNYPVAGTVRGSAKQKDWYYFQGINISIGLGRITGGNFGRNQTDCPGRVL
jgi:hypothetical protein